MSITRIIGIDFGTSTSVIRTKRYEDGKPLGDQLYTKEVKFGNSGLVPTLIQHIEGAQPYYGYDAQKKHKNAVTHENFKVGLESPDERIRMQSRKLTEEFFSYMAKKYKEQESMGFFGETDDAVKTLVSYPVKWSEETRAFMMEAARKAGFANVEGMDEAQAAITAVMVQSADHLSKRNYLRDGTPVNILIADMGAGTTDLVLCRYTPGKDPRYEILSAWPKDGNTLFGGREVEALLQEYLRGIIPGEKADAVMRRFSIEKAKSWKEDYVSPALRRCETVTECGELDVIAELLEINVEEFSLERSEMERLAGDYLKGFPMLVNGCLRDAGIPGSNVDLVLLTGGHSQWYFVEEQLCGRLNQYGEIDLGKIRSDPGRLISVPCPQETVALGLVYSPLIKEQVTFAPKSVQQAAAQPAAGNLPPLSEPEDAKSSLEHRINIIDTPGHVDFMVEVERSLRVLDGTVGIFCAKGGVEPQSENVWRQADTYNVPRMAFINKMDIMGADFYGAVEQIKNRLGKNAIVLQLPIGKEDDFKGIIDLFDMKAYIYNDDKGDDITVTDDLGDMKDDAELYRSELVEKICELDDDLMMMYLEGEEPSTEQLKAALRKGTCECTAVPVCCGSAYRNKGVQKFLDAVLEYMPAPTDISAIKGTDLDGNEVEQDI